MDNFINFNREKSKKLIFHNIKNKYWNYFSLELNAGQCSFIYSSDPNFFSEFKKILERENSYNGFILEDNEPYEYGKNTCFSDFLTKESFEKNKNKLVIEVLLSHWKIEPFKIKTNTTRKYILYLTIKKIDRFLKNFETEINFLSENRAQSFKFIERINKFKEEYQVLNEYFHNLYVKTELNPNIEQENLKEELKLSAPYLDAKFDNLKLNETNAQIALQIIKNDVKNIINQHNSMMNSLDADPYKIKIFVTGYNCFLDLIKKSGDFRWLSSQQIYEIYYKFELWLGKLLNQKTLENILSVQNFFSKTFADEFWIFWKQNRQQKILEERNKKAQKHFKIKKINYFRKENPYYQNLKMNSKTLLRANILWQHEVIKMEKKLRKKSFQNSFFGKRIWIASIENKLKKLREKIAKPEYKNYFIFLKDTLNDLKNFFYFHNLKKIDLFLRKNQFLIFCFKNKINFDVLYKNYDSLSQDNLFFLEIKKMQMGNYSRFLFDEHSFFLETSHKQRLFQHFFSVSENPVQLFIYSRRTIKPIRDFSIIFVEKGTLIEYIREIDLPLTPKTSFAKFFYQNSTFDRTNLHLLETQLYKQLQNGVFQNNSVGINNNFESFANSWSPIKEVKLDFDFENKKYLLKKDILVIDL
ncbi:Uncharacterised protein [Mesomycoplasma dispar]|uniref:DUF2357 domain-containing protein n=1 Tax=Mesomycoplasma dispar TaxID=86660 RepID=A0AAJ5TCJ2_9BACT|nr:hypothetical protein [Mesomycoplasma dispar]AJR12501.1 hypothetical protein MDIS_04095 [Mesomycoplasma dispar]VEU62782.1 Uncharacterised protein [Mesomycoplasma dispar]